VALAAVVYLPAIQRFGLASITANKFVAPFPWPLFVSSLPGFARRLREALGLGIPTLLLLPLVLVAVLPLATRWPGRSRVLTLVCSTALWCIVLLMETRRTPPPRVWLFLLPLCCICVGIGVAQVAGWLSRTSRVGEPVLVAATALVMALGLSVSTVVRRTVLEDDDSVGFIAGPAVARYLLAEARPGDRIVVSNFVSPEVDYYLFTQGGRRFADLEAPSRSDRLLLIANERVSQSPQTIQAERPDLDWSRFEPPAPLRKFERASVHAAARRVH
jgi:hypothetical protein